MAMVITLQIQVTPLLLTLSNMEIIPTESKDVPVQIFYNEQDITKLVRRAQEASKILENLRIVGPTVSGNPRNGIIIR
jgi:hypothetical protein